jgi:hypothetical protein
MAEIPLFLLRDKNTICRKPDAEKSEQQEFESLSKLIRPEIPEEPMQSLDAVEAARVRAAYCLLQDLAEGDWEGRMSRNGNEQATISLRRPKTALSKSYVRKAMEPRRLELIAKSAKWIRWVEPKVTKHLVNGSQIVPSQVKPELEECQSRRQKDLFRYCRLLSSVPYSEYVGRRMHFLIRDAGLPNRPIMGIAALGSSLLQIRCRDEWIGWNRPELRSIKKLRIANLMDLYVAVGIPPYNDLLGGKLICYMMASNEVREAFKEKYKDRRTFSKKRIVTDLAMIVTTSVYGRHSSQYNRVRYGGNLLYIPVGETVGFGTLHIGEETFAALRDMLALEDAELGHRFGDGANWRLRVVREGMDRLGFDSDECLQHGYSRGVYVIPLVSNVHEFLQGKTDEIDYLDYPLAELIAHWRERWLDMRSKNPEVLERVRSFKRESLLLTRLLGRGD